MTGRGGVEAAALALDEFDGVGPWRVEGQYQISPVYKFSFFSPDKHE